ncbi:MAG: hypothetical protein R3F48_01060 [Candidatus Zixiibacteriota bacterium]
MIVIKYCDAGLHKPSYACHSREVVILMTAESGIQSGVLIKLSLDTRLRGYDIFKGWEDVNAGR